LLQALPVVIEVDADRSGIRHTILVTESRQAAVLASLRTALPGVRIDAIEAVRPAPRFRAGVELRLTSRTIPLGDERAAAAANGVLANLQPLTGGSVRLQWLLAGVRTRKTPGPRLALSNLLPAMPQTDHGTSRDQDRKHRAPLLIATGRIAAGGQDTYGYGAVQQIVGALRVLEAPGVSLLRRLLPGQLIVRRVTRRQMPLLFWPMTLNVLEAVGAVALPLHGIVLPGLRLGASRQVPPSPDMPRSGGVIIAESTYPGVQQPLVMKPKDRTMHTYFLGPNGTGKSTLLANMALQDIEAGYGCVVFDPKADLVTEILARYPEHRRDDLWLLDPSNVDRPVGFNPLAAPGNEHDRELAAETITHILKDIFREFWGPRTDDLLRAAVLSLVQVPAPTNEPFTMAEIAELLTNAPLRRYVAGHPLQHERWRDYWHAYDQRPESSQLAMVGPVLNKLRAFTHRTSLRLVLGQANGIDLEKIFTERKVLLVPLSEGQIGAEAAALIGSLLVGSLWQATMRRASVPVDKRRPAFAYLDEFQNLVRFTDDVPDMLAMARGLGLGLILAHQYIKQVPDSVRSAVLGTARSQIFYQLEYDDSQLVAKRTEPVLTADDLRGLGRFEIAARLCVDGQTRAPVTGRTLPLPQAIRDPEELRRELAEAQGMARADIEAALSARRQPMGGRRPTRLGQVPSQETDACAS
jgi:hypothetical protein